MLYLLFLLFLPPSLPLAHADWLGEHWEKIPATSLPALAPDGDLDDFRLAIRRQKENCAGAKSGKLTICGDEGKGPPLACDDTALAKLSGLAARTKSWPAFYGKAKVAFDWYRYRTTEKVLFTGYNSPLFVASRAKSEKFPYPLYGLPADLVGTPEGPRRRLPDGTLAPFYDRKAIETDHVLAGRGLEIAWLETPTDVLRLQIEGSGVLRYEDGKETGVNYAGKNGLPFVSVFKTLKARGVDKKYLTFPGLRRYHADHTAELRSALDESPSYVFFSLAKEPACGSARVHVTGGHSVAVDPTQVGLGSAMFLAAERPVEGTDPDATNVPTKPFTRFAFAQDTGGAIKGAHVDVYWGTGDYAMLASNSMQSHGDLYLLRSKTEDRLREETKSPRKRARTSPR